MPSDYYKGKRGKGFHKGFLGMLVSVYFLCRRQPNSDLVYYNHADNYTYEVPGNGYFTLLHYNFSHLGVPELMFMMCCTIILTHIT